MIVAAENARLNHVSGRLDLIRGGPEALSGSWPLVLANILAAPLIDLAPALVQRVQHGGRLVLSGVSNSMVPEVEQAYRRLGMRRLGETARAGWAAMVLCPSW